MDVFGSDALFDSQYPVHAKELSFIHWSPMEVVLKAVDWLDVKQSTKVLDIGSGVGKFCMVGAQASNAHFFGIELRSEFVEISRSLAKKLKLKNAHFIHADVTKIDFSEYDAFYYYNPFCEMLSEKTLIDEQITFSRERHRAHEDYVLQQLERCKKGTKIVLYCSSEFALPSSYQLRDLYFDGTLSLWEKTIH